MATVLVTGSTGFIASILIKLLIEKGFNVRGTVRSKSKVSTDFNFDVSKVSFYEADLLKPGSFDEAVADCEYVFHVAMSTDVNVVDPVKDMLEPSLKGTQNVLKACEKNKKLKRIILTSSVAAIAQRQPGHKNTEADWNLGATLENDPYDYSKVQAEKFAWDFVKGKHFDMVTIHPTFVIGYPGNNRIPTSTLPIYKMMNGDMPVVPDLAFNFVNVRDVGLAHILAMDPKASGRYIITNQARNMKQIQEILLNKFGTEKYKIPTWDFTGYFGSMFLYFYAYSQETLVKNQIQNQLGHVELYDNSRMKGLGLTNLIEIDQSILETADYFVEKNLIKNIKTK